MLIRRGQIILREQTTALQNRNPTSASGIFEHSITALAHSTQQRCDVRSFPIGPRQRAPERAPRGDLRFTPALKAAKGRFKVHTSLKGRQRAANGPFKVHTSQRAPESAREVPFAAPPPHARLVSSDIQMALLSIVAVAFGRKGGVPEREEEARASVLAICH